eukprot:m.356893 g.356893  ORF g.356893 m.356893 type:complete len:386 (+) comp17655_c0_seq1:138-1295(+)
MASNAPLLSDAGDVYALASNDAAYSDSTDPPPSRKTVGGLYSDKGEHEPTVDKTEMAEAVAKWERYTLWIFFGVTVGLVAVVAYFGHRISTTTSVRTIVQYQADCHVEAWPTNNNGGVNLTNPYLPDVPLTFVPPVASVAENAFTMFWANSMDRGVLVQPAFLGFDNSYLLEQLDRFPNTLRGVVTVDPDTSTEEDWMNLHRRGVRGVRLNLLGVNETHMQVLFAKLQTESWTALAQFMRRKRWHFDVLQEGARWKPLMEKLLETECRIVVDALGRPGPFGVDDVGFQAILDAATSNRVWIKVSAPFYLQVDDDGKARIMRRYLETFGQERLVWGSAYPFIQEKQEPGALPNYEDQKLLVAGWFRDTNVQKYLLRITASELYNFD